MAIIIILPAGVTRSSDCMIRTWQTKGGARMAEGKESTRHHHHAYPPLLHENEPEMAILDLPSLLKAPQKKRLSLS